MKELHIRLTDSDLERLDMVADLVGGGSRNKGISFLIRWWTGEWGPKERAPKVGLRTLPP